LKRLIRYVAPLVVIFGLAGLLRLADAGVTPSSITSLRSPTLVFNGPNLSSQLLRIGETGSVPPYLGSGLQRPVGSFLYNPNGALAYIKTAAGPTGWEQLSAGSIAAGTTDQGALTARASQLVGFGTGMTCFREDFVTTAPTGYATILAGSGTSSASALNDVGAHWILATGATASSRVRFGGNGNVIGKPNTNRFYMAWRWAVTSGVDAQTNAGVGFSDISIAGVNFGPAVCGATSTTNYVFQYDSTGAATCSGTKVASNSIAINATLHVWEVWALADGKLHFAVDFTEQVTSPVTMVSPGSNSNRLQADVLNGTTAANRAIDMDYYQICWGET